MIVDIFNTNKKYNLVLADPPWKQTKNIRKVRPNQTKNLDYKTIPLEEIEKHLLEVTEKHTTENSILFLWTIEKFLPQAEEIAKKIGYKLHARLIWDKENGMAPAFSIRYSHEYLLYLYKGKFTKVATEQRGKITSVFRERATKHSKKPIVSYEIIEKLYPNAKRLEMYARNERKDWDSWGNEL